MAAENKASALTFNIERPAGLNYRVELATELEKQYIIRRLRAGNRQTMNVRTMPTARFIILRDMDLRGKIIGWQGLDYETKLNFPEKFSLHLDEEYRSFLLGLVLEHAFAIHLKSIGIEIAYVRMDVSGNFNLSQFRTKNGFFTQLEPSNLDQEWVEKCKQCELFKGSCKEQGFFSFHVSQLIDFATRRLGPANFTEFPAKVVLVETMIRKGDEDQVKLQARWGA